MTYVDHTAIDQPEEGWFCFVDFMSQFVMDILNSLLAIKIQLCCMQNIICFLMVIQLLISYGMQVNLVASQ